MQNGLATNSDDVKALRHTRNYKKWQPTSSSVRNGGRRIRGTMRIRHAQALRDGLDFSSSVVHCSIWATIFREFITRQLFADVSAYLPLSTSPEGIERRRRRATYCRLLMHASTKVSEIASQDSFAVCVCVCTAESLTHTHTPQKEGGTK